MAFLKVSYHCYFLPTAPPSGTEGKKTLSKVAISTPWGRQRFGDDWREDMDAENQIPQNEGEQRLNYCPSFSVHTSVAVQCYDTSLIRVPALPVRIS